MSSSSLTSDLRPPTSNRECGGEVLVKVENVSKIFCRDLKKSLWYGLQDSAKDLFSFGKQRSEIRGQKSDPLDAPSSLLTSDLRLPTSSSDSSLTSDLRPPTSDSRTLRPSEFLAVDNVSFELKRGECLGLIGRNGAGKTTLLKMITGLIKPDAGRIEMHGRIGALIALGSGFNPILSGRENIYINGSILGLSKAEIDAKIDEIIDFAEIGDFIDSPVQCYSSGMQVRLGFAVATAMDPDVLILDEVLAVGDVRFRFKCSQRINTLINKAAVIFVSHDETLVRRLSNRALLMNRGLMKFEGNVVEAFLNYSCETGGPSCEKIEITDHGISDVHLSASENLEFGCDLVITVSFKASHAHPPAHFRVLLFDEEKNPVAEYNSLVYDLEHPIKSGDNMLNFSVPNVRLRPGDYTTACVLHHRNHLIQYFRVDNSIRLKIRGSIPSCAPMIL